MSAVDAEGPNPLRFSHLFLSLVRNEPAPKLPAPSGEEIAVHEAIEALSESRREILSHLKQRGGASISELATHLGISDEGTRQHLIQLERSGWVTRRDPKENTHRSGRPASVYFVSARGEVFFPKKYEELTLAVLGAVADLHGESAVEAALARITDEKVKEWTARLRGKTLEQKLDLLKNYYREGDEFTSVEHSANPALIERNCPFLDVARSKPALCCTTVNVLSRVLGCEVRRRRTFQGGDGCCEFEVRVDRPIDATPFPFATEPALSASKED
jgi:DeoR family transcriptional regulator, suf operon transcriptional repressor